MFAVSIFLILAKHPAPTFNNQDVQKQAPVATEQPITSAEVETQAEKVAEPAPVEPPVAERVVPSPIGCEYYRELVASYDWNVNVALAVMNAESSCNPFSVNNTPATGDYSVGLFQINLYGANAYSRPSETELQDPATNIAWAYKLYSGNGNSFIGQWGVCRQKVSCY